MMYASSKNQEQYPWWAGNARFIDLSNVFIVAHVAQAALIMLWAGLITLFELSVYSPDAPMYSQGLILLPHLATEGWGGNAGVDADLFFKIGVIHIVSAVVLAAGALFHRDRLSPSLDMERGNASNFHFEWGDSKKLGFILGHHLIILGLGALLLVAKATSYGGLYDANLEAVRVVTDPTLDPGTIWSYRTSLFYVDNLEDLVGGHIYVAALLILGGAWHIVVPPFNWVKRVFMFSADGILAYSLFGLALAGFAASYYCGFNTLAYPVEFYGPSLVLQSSFLPYYFDPSGVLEQGYTARMWLANAHFYLAFFFLQGGLWHFQLAKGFDPKSMLQSWEQSKIAASDNPSLVYQKPILLEPRPQLQVSYGMPQAKTMSLLKREQPFEDYFYCQSQGIETSDLTEVNGVERTLYQTTYNTVDYRFYQRAREDAAKESFAKTASLLDTLYGMAKTSSEFPSHSRASDPAIYEPR